MDALAPRVARVEVTGPYELAVEFSDGSRQPRVALEPALVGNWLGPLRDPAVFNDVTIDAQGSLRWPTGAGIDPWTLHDWPNAGPRWIAQVQKNARRQRRVRILQKCLLAVGVPWFFYMLGSWRGWFGEPGESGISVLLFFLLIALTLGQLTMFRPRRI